MDVGWTIARGVATAAAGLVASKAVALGWKGLTGRNTPQDDADDDFSVKEILAFAVASALVIAVAQVFAAQGAKKWYGPPRRVEAA
ncbi:MAG TPA: DUF4235 domain-containing protein [Actinomycetaceae bacterium]|nr:DUF4235 domain-containing protein [Actinomycetaceae bacterium]